MSEFCAKCFLELNPELTEKDLIMIKGDDLCEGCGKIVDEVVWKVKDKSERIIEKINNDPEKIIHKFAYNHLSGTPEILLRKILRETRTSYYIEDVPYQRGGTRIPKQCMDSFIIGMRGNEYPVMYSLRLDDNYEQYLKQLIECLKKELEEKNKNLDRVKWSYDYQHQNNSKNKESKK